MTKYPRLYVKGKFNKIVRPISASIIENITPLSTATMTLPRGEELPARSWVELFTPYGSAGMFRVRAPHNAYGDNSSTAELEHMISEVGDYCVKDEIDKMMSAKTAISTIFSHYKGGKWKLGKYSDIGTGQVAVEVKYDSVLGAMLGILEQKPECMMTFDFSTTPWTLNIVKRGTKVVSQGRLARNVSSATVSYDDSELVTRVWYQVYDKDEEGKVTGKRWVKKDADTLKTYGIVEAKVQTSADMTDAEINATVDAYLKSHKQPITSVVISAEELNKITGERMDKFVIGDLFRLALPDYGLNVELNITSITWSDVYGDSRTVMLQLGQEEDTIVTFLHNLDATGSGTTGGTGGGGAAGKREDEWSEFQSDWQVLNDQIYGYVRQVNEHNEILRQAGLHIDSETGVLLYAQDSELNIESHIQVQANRITDEVSARQGADGELKGMIQTEAGKISLVVEERQSGNVIKAASIVTAINSTGSSVVISADHIQLDGYVTVSDLEVTNGNIDNLVTGKTKASKLLATTMEAQEVKTDNLTLDRHGLTCGSVIINGTSYNVVRWT